MNPMTPKHIHLLGICGTGMAALAGILKEQGYPGQRLGRSRLSAHEQLRGRAGDRFKNGYAPENLAPRPDLVVIGNVIRRDNPEAQAVLSPGACPTCPCPRPWTASCWGQDEPRGRRHPRQDDHHRA